MPQIGINFRNSAAYVTDGANETHCIFDGSYAESYPTTRYGETFGWISPGSAVQTRDRNSGTDRRLAGMHFLNTNVVRDFKWDRINETYDIAGAFGDYNYAVTNLNAEFLDDATSVHSVSADATGAERFMDPTGVTHTPAAWPGSNNTQQEVFSDPDEIFILRVERSTTPTLNPRVAHISLSWTAAGDPEGGLVGGKLTGGGVLVRGRLV